MAVSEAFKHAKSLWAMSKTELCPPELALPGRTEPMPRPPKHLVLGTPYDTGAPEGHREILVGMGCFWGAERLYWNQAGVWRTAAGYAGGHTPNPSYREVCSGKSAHTEVVQVIYDPGLTDLSKLLQVFWENHDPTQGMRQGNDIGSQYRSAIYLYNTQDFEEAQASKERYEAALKAQGRASITTEIRQGLTFFFAEIEHQQYLHTHPQGYCGLAGTGVACPGAPQSAGTSE